MKASVYKNYGKSRVLCVSLSSRCEFIHEQDFPVPHMGSRMVVPKEKGRRSIREVLYEVSTVAQTRSQQKLFQGSQ